MNTGLFLRVAVVGAATGLALASASPTRAADDEVVITANTIEPAVLRTVTGQRVTFVSRVSTPVHVEFGIDPRQHQVHQLPATGPVWAIFHRPGTHPYTVHIYRDRGTIALPGLVEVAENPRHPWEVGLCGAEVMGDCLEP